MCVWVSNTPFPNTLASRPFYGWFYKLLKVFACPELLIDGFSQLAKRLGACWLHRRIQGQVGLFTILGGTESLSHRLSLPPKMVTAAQSV